MPQNKAPTALRILKGNPSKRALPKNEPQPDAGAEMPDNLSPVARQQWITVCEQLERAGLLTQVDRDALALYCETFARYREALDHLSRESCVVTSPNGYPIKNPWLTLAERAQDQMVALLREFGMTPAARSRVTVTNPRPKENKFLALLQKSGDGAIRQENK
jgi:P27 family predicted phage terminase small subunit